jgi:hypothetical protein
MIAAANQATPAGAHRCALIGLSDIHERYGMVRMRRGLSVVI